MLLVVLVSAIHDASPWAPAHAADHAEPATTLFMSRNVVRTLHLSKFLGVLMQTLQFMVSQHSEPSKSRSRHRVVTISHSVSAALLCCKFCMPGVQAPLIIKASSTASELIAPAAKPIDAGNGYERTPFCADIRWQKDRNARKLSTGGTATVYR